MGNDRLRSLVFLVLWIVFIIMICIIFIKPASNYVRNQVPNENNNEVNNLENTEKVITFADMQEKLLSKNYTYVYNYNNEIVYKGDLLGKRSVGYEETTKGIKKYYIDDGHQYDVNFGTLTEVTYEEVFKTFFDVEYLFNLIDNQNITTFDNKVNYQADDLSIIFTVANENIESIEVTKGQDYYYLTFSKIGQITEINY